VLELKLVATISTISCFFFSAEDQTQGIIHASKASALPIELHPLLQIHSKYNLANILFLNAPMDTGMPKFKNYIIALSQQVEKMKVE
jgi:hypothetical protein